jgi:uncharacterized protein DUF4124
MKWLLVLAVALLPPTAVAQAMYKCVDARGVTHYADKPLPGCKARESEPKGQPPAPGKAAAQKEAPKRQERAVQRPKTAAEKAKEAELRALEQHNRRCGLLKGELRRIERSERLRTADEARKSSTLEDAARASRATALRGQIGRECR